MASEFAQKIEEILKSIEEERERELERILEEIKQNKKDVVFFKAKVRRIRSSGKKYGNKKYYSLVVTIPKRLFRDKIVEGEEVLVIIKKETTK